MLVRRVDELQPTLQALRSGRVGRLWRVGRRVGPSLPESGEGAHEAAAAARRALAAVFLLTAAVRRDLQRAKGVPSRELASLCALSGTKTEAECS